jgi:hypothetical protein
MVPSRKTTKAIVDILIKHAGQEAAQHIAAELCALKSNQDFMAAAVAIQAEMTAQLAPPAQLAAS